MKQYKTTLLFWNQCLPVFRVLFSHCVSSFCIQTTLVWSFLTKRHVWNTFWSDSILCYTSDSLRIKLFIQPLTNILSETNWNICSRLCTHTHTHTHTHSYETESQIITTTSHITGTQQYRCVGKHTHTHSRRQQKKKSWRQEVFTMQ